MQVGMYAVPASDTAQCRNQSPCKVWLHHSKAHEQRYVRADTAHTPSSRQRPRTRSCAFQVSAAHARVVPVPVSPLHPDQHPQRTTYTCRDKALYAPRGAKSSRWENTPISVPFDAYDTRAPNLSSNPLQHSPSLPPQAVHQLRRVVATAFTEATALPAALPTVLIVDCHRRHRLSPPPSSPPAPFPAPLPSRVRAAIKPPPHHIAHQQHVPHVTPPLPHITPMPPPAVPTPDVGHIIYLFSHFFLLTFYCSVIVFYTIQ
ncbi:hypothetical protein B0H16DRAFT_1797926 [Mycena metata]|uniref:Uncharacterized protein n=1 Tax=Mycena metata TaxID=1033252 RepID=A0AAD7HD94_9AGAR|nr:hypothetical protein B0H16DRAFT_1797926 [Mycena metata]